MSSDSVRARRLGEDYDATIGAHGPSDEADERYLAIDEEILLDLDDLDATELSRLMAVVRASIERSCTIEPSVAGGIALTKTVNGVPL
ncbi:hypothetical protein [Glaciibacter psychrotolerans]|uniref:Uncharacterized protein n=1 Tax=Glaciibacter psychrotolerans TaxID=670054 RepID=A0A7Z0EHW8_9MICO|nr:hypothetical protein [Leifsonia psychrotolerans]NYJ21550.1 hypothetical protein [Leifsonia psychrotolerans]